MTLPNDIQADAQTVFSSQLFVKCPGVCRRHIDLERVKLAGGGRNRTVWNCKICRLMNKKQVKVTWYHLICVRCTQTHGKNCLIQYCGSNCPTKQGIQKKKKGSATLLAKGCGTLVASSKVWTSKKVHQMFNTRPIAGTLRSTQKCVDSWRW